MSNPIDVFIKYDIIKAYKKGVRDALINKKLDTKQAHQYYKEGYEDGMTLYIEMQNLEGEKA